MVRNEAVVSRCNELEVAHPSSEGAAVGLEAILRSTYLILIDYRVVMPTTPCMESRSIVAYVLRRSLGHPCAFTQTQPDKGLVLRFDCLFTLGLVRRITNKLPYRQSDRH